MVNPDKPIYTRRTEEELKSALSSLIYPEFDVNHTDIVLSDAVAELLLYRNLVGEVLTRLEKYWFDRAQYGSNRLIHNPNRPSLYTKVLASSLRWHSQGTRRVGESWKGAISH